MSRARPFTHNGVTHWFDRRAKATPAQLELLADIEGVDIDDLLDEGLSQRQVLVRLHEGTNDNLIPAEVIERRRERARVAAIEPVCRICGTDGDCEGRITRHHYVPRWMMLMLENYQAYAARSKCTIPICVGRHQDLHYRGEIEEERPKSIVPYLTEPERKFAQKMLDELRTQQPVLFDLIAGGDERSYEGQLLKDYFAGEFRKADDCYEAQVMDSPVIAAVGEGA